MAIIIAGTSAAGARADQIVSDNANHTNAKIVNLLNGQLRFQSADGVPQSVWLSEVSMIIVDREGVFNDFNQAERFLANGEPEQAIARYRRTLRLSEEFWSDLIAARLLVACDRAGRLDQATLNFIRVVRGKWSGSALAARLTPRQIPAKRTAKALRAIEHLDAAIAAKPSPDQAATLTMLRFDILARTKDVRADAAAVTVAKLTLPEDQRCERTFEILLAALRLRALNQLDESERVSLDRAIRDCPDRLLPDFLLLKGRVLSKTALTKRDMIRATWPLMRVVAHMPDDPRAAEGLFETALTLDRIGRRDKAIDLLTECLAHEHIRAETRQKAEAKWKELKDMETS